MFVIVIPFFFVFLLTHNINYPFTISSLELVPESRPDQLIIFVLFFRERYLTKVLVMRNHILTAFTRLF